MSEGKYCDSVPLHLPVPVSHGQSLPPLRQLVLPAAAGLPRFDRKSEQYLCAGLLRHGKAVASDGTVGLLSRLLPLLRGAFPRVRILVRLDGSSRCGAAAPHAPPEAVRSPSLMVQVSTPSGYSPEDGHRAHARRR